MPILFLPYVPLTGITSGNAVGTTGVSTMATYGGFGPGNYNAWALNLLTDVFCTPGVGRGMSVTAPGGMAVTVGVDGTAGDGVVVLPNGGWVRIDQAVTFTVPSNTSGSTRNDAVVAFLDPTGVANPEYSLTYNSNWAGGFTGNTNNQWVIATISVPNNAVSISLSNITMNPSVANFGNPCFIQATNDYNGLLVSDSASNTYLQVGYKGAHQPTPNPRSIVLTAQDSSGTWWNYYLNYTGYLTVPTGMVWGNGVNGNYSFMNYSAANHANQYFTPQSGSYDQTHLFMTWHSAASQLLFEVGGAYASPQTYIDYVGNLAFSPTSNGIIFDGYSNVNGTTQNYKIYAAVSNPGGTSGKLDLNIGNMLGGYIYFPMANGSSHFDNNGHLYDPTNGGSPVALSGSGAGVRIFTGTSTPTNATNGDIWINA